MGDDTLVSAEMVRTGDKLLYQGEHRSVLRIQTINCRGLYHPVTECGDIVVSGVGRASMYASVLGVDSDLESFVTHSILLPLHLACGFNFAICKNEEYTVEGFSMTINVAIQLAFRITQQKSILHILWLIVSMPSIVLMLALGNTCLLCLLFVCCITLNSFCSPGAQKMMNDTRLLHSQVLFHVELFSMTVVIKKLDFNYLLKWKYTQGSKAIKLIHLF
jgi:hypothetical protein